MAKVCLIGAGKLGARHLQAMKGFKEPHDIFVVEPMEASREEAKKIYEDTQGQDNRVLFASGIEDVANQTTMLDVAVVATSSAPRRAVIEELLARLDVKYMILEKVLFQKIKDIDEVGILLKNNGVKAWVNCPRRYFGIYDEIKRDLQEAEEFQVSVSGSKWGLGCNGIHFLDLIAFLADIPNGHVDISGLDSDIIESKRKGFYEITGRLSGNFGRCTDFSITSYKSGDIPNSVIITSDVSKYIVMEWASKVIEITKEKGTCEKSITIPFQSQLTNAQIEDILYSGECKITSYDESAMIHKALMEPLSSFFKEKGFGDDICPIT